MDKSNQQDAANFEVSEKHVVEYLKSLLKSLKQADDFIDLDKHIKSLEDWVFRADHHGVDFQVVLANFTQSDLLEFNNAYCAWETELERIFTDSLLSGERISLNDYKLSERFVRLLKREVSLLHQKPKKALFIGSGPFPVSAIYLQQILGIPVDCLDNCARAVELSKRMISSMGLKNLEVFHGDGCSFDASAYDMVLVALLAKPKSEILKNLYITTQPHCQVICRTSHDFRRLIYETTDMQDHLYHYHMGGACRVEVPGDTISSVLLQKESGTDSVAKSHTASPKISAMTRHGATFTWPLILTPERKLGIIELLNKILAEETLIGFPGVLDMEEGLRFVNNLQVDITAGSSLLLNILSTEGMLIGMAILKRDPQPNCRHVVEVCKGMIHPQFRGEGLMEAAFLEIAEKCLEEGMDLIKLDVREGTKAEKVWRFLGFKTYGRLEDYAREGDQIFAGCYMSQYAEELKERLLQALISKGKK